MLTVFQADSSASVHVLFGSNTVRLKQSFVLLYPGTASESYETGVAPVNYGSRNFIGDSSCIHHNMKGTLAVLPYDTGTNAVRSSYEYEFPTGVLHDAVTDYVVFPGGLTSSDIIVWGSSGIYPMKHSYVWNGGEFQEEYEVRFMDSSTVAYRKKTTKRQVSTGVRTVTFSSITYWQYDFVAAKPVSRQCTPSSKRWIIPKTGWTAWGLWSKTPTQHYVFKGCLPDKLPKIDARDLTRRFFSDNDGWLALDPQEMITWGDLAQDAVGNATYVSINTDAYIADFWKFVPMIRGLLPLLKGNVSPKALSQLYLTWHYGVRLTIQDTEELAVAIQRALHVVRDTHYQVVRARASKDVVMGKVGGTLGMPGIRNYNFKLYYNPIDTKLKKTILAAMSWDLYPTASNLWDFLPFSFVVDWFVGVQDELERQEVKGFVNNLDILSCILTSSTSFNLAYWQLAAAPAGAIVVGTITATLYERRVQPWLPMPISRVEVSKGFTHWVEGATLLIQKMG